MLHLEVGTALDGLALEFELDDADGLVHLCRETCQTRCGAIAVAEPLFGEEAFALIVTIDIKGKCGQWQQVDAISILNDILVVISQRVADDVADAAVVAGCGSNPQNVVVAPLDVQVVIGAQDVHDFVGALATVEHIAQNVQTVDGELVDEVAHGDDEVVGTACADDGAHNHVDIALLVGVAGALMQQLLDDVREVAGQGFCDL